MVEVTPLGWDAAVPAGTYDVLLTFGSVAPPNLSQALSTTVDWVHVTSTGIDEFPLELLGNRVLTNNRGGSGGPISEWVLAMMLAFEKNIPDVWITGAGASWYIANLGSLQGRQLAIVGFGSIGQCLARRAQAFGMNVTALRRSERPSPIDGVGLARSLDDLLARADPPSRPRKPWLHRAME